MGLLNSMSEPSFRATSKVVFELFHFVPNDGPTNIGPCRRAVVLVVQHCLEVKNPCLPKRTLRKSSRGRV